MARPNKGLHHVDGLQGERPQKQRLRCILETLFGQQSVADACEQLGIGPTYFGMLRTRVLQGGLDALAAKPVGRPPLVPPALRQELEQQQARLAELERENLLLRTQLELMAVARGDAKPKSRGRG